MQPQSEQLDATRLRELRALATDAEAWILLRSSKALQIWFAGQKLPFVIAGSAFSPTDTFHLDLDQAAVCRHAAAEFRRHGHRHAAIILGDRRRAGEQASEKGFIAGCGEGCRASVVTHRDSPVGMKRAIDSLLRLQPPVTGILCADGRQTTLLVSRLMHSGWKIPCDISVISRDDDPILDYLLPDIARYRRSPQKFAGKCATLLAAAVAGTRPRGSLMIPDFMKAESLGPAAP